MSDIGDRVRELRTEQGLNVSELARRSGLTPTGVGLVEKGQRMPSSTTVEKLARGLGVDPGELYTSPKVQGPPPRTIAELLDVAGVEDRELENPPDHINELFDSLSHSYEETIALARRIINARRAVKAVIDRYDADPDTPLEEKRILKERLGTRTMRVNMIAIASAHAVAQKELRIADEEGDAARAAEVVEDIGRLEQVP